MTNVYLEFQDLTSGLQRVPLFNDATRIGRDPSVDVVIAANAANVSRRHAEIREQDGVYIVVDLGSFNGTFLNGRRIAGGEILHDGDVIQLGPGGPSLRFRAPANPDAVRTAHLGHSGALPQSGRLAQPKNQTIFANKDTGALQATLRGGDPTSNEPRVFLQRALDRPQLTIGRGEECDIRLDGLLISNTHARISQTSSGVLIEDLNSTNGTYVNGERIAGRRNLPQEDVVQIGPFLLRVNPQRGVTVFDTRSKTRLDVVRITKEVTNRSGGGKIRLLDEVDLSIQPNEFVGLLGPSGAGKSTLMDSMNGMRPASSGHVLVNNLDLYQHLESLKQSIGYVPQDDIIHRELTVYRTLYYVARLRLSRDISTQEIDQVVSEVMDITGLSERRDVPISQLSGGQRKRVSIAVELITKPSVIFLDEPTSGLDPATEEKVMKLFRQIAESGRTVILTTHAMENVKLFDKLVVLMRGKLVFYGKPQEALAHCGAESFKDLYDKLEAPIFEKLKSNGRANKDQIAEEVAEDWKRRFLRTDQYRMNVEIPLRSVSAGAHIAAPAKRRSSFGDWLRQWATLSRRYLEVLRADKFNLLILFGQAPIIAMLTYLVVGAKAPRDFIYFVLALVSLWFGTSVAAREIIRERAVYKRERMVNLRLLAYVGSKILILMLIVGLQCLLLFGTLKFLDVMKLMSFPGGFGGSMHLVVMIITSMVGITLGLFVSAVVKTSEMATSLIPLILIPQILFCGLVGIPTGMSKVVGVVMPATWAFDEMKRLSDLDLLRAKDEDAQPSDKEGGSGLYKQVERENDQNIEDARAKVDKYKADAEKSISNFEKKMEGYQKDLATGRTGKKPATPKLGPVPEIQPAQKIPDDLSAYVDFLHPWGSRVFDLGVLMAMFFTFCIATIVALRSQDV
ncbi:MAG TPA: FHA domain-containing protein [Pyrinomonadaceae bacterium]|nr:FHA domain-containing protein [Pyrinomonadaceae bacterium]